MKFVVLFCTKSNYTKTLDHLMAPQFSDPLKLVSYELHDPKDTFFSRPPAKPLNKTSFDVCPMSHNLFDTIEEAMVEAEKEIAGIGFPKSAMFKIREWDAAFILATDNIGNDSKQLNDQAVRKIFEKPFHKVFFMKPNKNPEERVLKPIELSEPFDKTLKAKL